MDNRTAKMVLVAGIVSILVGGITYYQASTMHDRTLLDLSQTACNSELGQGAQSLIPQVGQDCQGLEQDNWLIDTALTVGPALIIIGFLLSIAGGLSLTMTKGDNDDLIFWGERQEGQQLCSLTEEKIYCRYCGRIRPVSAELCSECGVRSSRASYEFKTCTSCNFSLSSDSRFCGNCGQQLLY